MSGTKTGSTTIIKLVRHICRIVAIYGASDLATRTTPAFQAAVLGLTAACDAFTALDDFPGQIDATEPIRAGEDVGPA